MKTTTFIDCIKAYSTDHPRKAPPIPVVHPYYGEMGFCDHKGFSPPKGRWASTKAILRDDNKHVVKVLRKFEDLAPSFAIAAVASTIVREPAALPMIIGAITTYDGLVAARGGGLYYDVWMALTTGIGGVSTQWYDFTHGSWTPGSAPSITAYTNAGTGGAVLTAASNGSWLPDPGGTNKRYLISVGFTSSTNGGCSLIMLIDNLWAGSYSANSNTTINPSTDVAVTRYSGTAAAGNRLMSTLYGTLTHSVAATITTTYTDDTGGTGDTTASIMPATGALVNRILYNTVHGAATLNISSPFQPMTNSGSAGVRNLEQIVISGGTVTASNTYAKIVRPLLLMPQLNINTYIEQDITIGIGNMIELVNASQVCGCLSWIGLTSGTTAETLSAMLRTVEG